jgi:cellulose synthase/poly-beta-1,6-N-acetylglucosamine synthase-like glycosyltransferase
VLSAFLIAAAVGASLFLTAYLVLWNLSQIAMSPVAAVYLWTHQRRNTRRARALVTRMAFRPLVSVVVPAYNEQLTIVESIRALLALDYDPFEIVVVNDGSTDETLSLLKDTFTCWRPRTHSSNPCRPRLFSASIDRPVIPVSS